MTKEEQALAAIGYEIDTDGDVLVVEACPRCESPIGPGKTTDIRPLSAIVCESCYIQFSR